MHIYTSVASYITKSRRAPRSPFGHIVGEARPVKPLYPLSHPRPILITSSYAKDIASHILGILSTFRLGVLIVSLLLLLLHALVFRRPLCLLTVIAVVVIPSSHFSPSSKGILRIEDKEGKQNLWE